MSGNTLLTLANGPTARWYGLEYVLCSLPLVLLGAGFVLASFIALYLGIYASGELQNKAVKTAKIASGIAIAVLLHNAALLPLIESGLDLKDPWWIISAAALGTAALLLAMSLWLGRRP